MGIAKLKFFIGLLIFSNILFVKIASSECADYLLQRDVEQIINEVIEDKEEWKFLYDLKWSFCKEGMILQPYEIIIPGQNSEVTYCYGSQDKKSCFPIPTGCLLIYNEPEGVVTEVRGKAIISKEHTKNKEMIPVIINTIANTVVKKIKTISKKQNTDEETQIFRTLIKKELDSTSFLVPEVVLKPSLLQKSSSGAELLKTHPELLKCLIINGKWPPNKK